MRNLRLVGSVLLANEAAQHLLAPEGPLQGQEINSYLPALRTVLKTQQPRVFRTTLQCTGKRSSGDVFLAGVWFSTYSTISRPRLAAIIVDLSEDLRNREDLSLDQPDGESCSLPTMGDISSLLNEAEIRLSIERHS